MSKRFRYLMLATALSLGMWAAILSGSVAVFNSLAPFAPRDDFAASSGQFALQMGETRPRSVSHE